MYFAPFWKEVYSKSKELAPWEQNFFSFIVDTFSEGNCAGKQLVNYKSCLPNKNGRKSTKCMQSPSVPASVAQLDARLTGDQEVVGSAPSKVANILSWRLIMKYFLRSFFPVRWFKKGSCQFQAKECAQYWLTTYGTKPAQ